MRFQLSGPALGAVVLFLCAGASPGQAQPHLVTDLNQGRVPAYLPAQLSQGVEHDGVLYFQGEDPQHGSELWRTDGTAEGTYALVDLCPGSCGGLGEPLGFFAGHLYFRGDDREHGAEIWRTDGTVGGEELLADLCPGACGIQPRSWVEWRGELWFLTQASGGTSTLWNSDATAAGTKPVANLCDDLDICGLGQDPRVFLDGPDPSGKGLLLREFPTDNHDAALFRTDGTLAGTVLLHRTSDGLRTIVEASGPLYFLDGLALWTSDGTPGGTRFVRRLDELTQGVFAESVTVVYGIFYAIFDNGDWLRSDGKAEGTIKLAQLDLPSFGFPKLARIGGAVFALTGNGVWRTGGTPETTVGFDAPQGVIDRVIEQPGRLFVSAHGGPSFVWTTDGTLNGTRRIHLAGPPNPDGEIAGFREGILISRYRELWKIDGAGATLEQVHDFQPENDGSGPIDQLVLGDRLVFLSLDGTRKLFSSDGSAAGTIAISAGPIYAFGSDFDFAYRPELHRLTLAGRRAFFRSENTFWTTDGSRAGTGPVYPTLAHTFLYMAAPIGFVGGRFLFGGGPPGSPYCPGGDAEPWASDGTPGGTKQVLNLNPFYQPEDEPLCVVAPLASSPGQGAVLGPVALIAADDLLHGRELFATDGTEAGTRLVRDVNPRRRPNPNFDPNDPQFGPEQIGEGSDPSDLVRAGSRAFFVADDGTTGRELWVTNGTRRGTRRVADLVAGPGSSTPRNLVAMGGDVFFFAANPRGDSGEGLYKSDGTGRGTVLVSPLLGASQARELTVVSGKLFFVAFRPESGTELWISEGTAATTREVTDLRAGPRGSQPQNLKAVGGRVVFAAEDGTSGLEPWSSDGTAEGTRRWGDIAPGAAASSPGPFSVANGQLLFGADDGEHGRELWAIPVAEVVGVR